MVTYEVMDASSSRFGKVRVGIWAQRAVPEGVNELSVLPECDEPPMA